MDYWMVFLVDLKKVVIKILGDYLVDVLNSSIFVVYVKMKKNEIKLFEIDYDVEVLL